MRRAIKITLITFGLMLLGVVLLGLFAWLRQDKIITALTAKVNETVNTRISYGDIRVTIFESFPNITVRFDDLLVEPSPYYDRTQFRGENNDTLFYTSSFSLTVSLPSLLTGTVAIRAISAKEGELTLLTDKRGNINYKVFAERKEDVKNVNLKNITAGNLRIVLNDRSSGMRVSGSLSAVALSGEFFRTGIYINTAVSAMIDSVNIKNIAFREIPVKAVVRLRKSASSLTVAKGLLEVADLNFEIDGSVNYSSSTLDLSVAGKKINISSVVSLLPEKWRSFTGSITPSGIVDLRGKITGPYGKAGNPHFEVNYDLSDGKMSHNVTGFKFNNLSFRGGLTNGDLNSAETFHCTIDDLTATYGSASVTGSFMINNLNRPHINLELDGDLDFDDLNRIMKSGDINDQTGSVKGSIRLSGTIPDTMGLVAALPLLKPAISLTFTEFGATMAERGIAVSDMSGVLAIGNDLVADSLSFTFREQHFTIDALMKNFVPWIAGKPEILDITGEIHADRFITAMFTDKKSDTTSGGGKQMNIFPADFRANVKFRADSLIFNDFSAGDLSASVNYKPFVLTFRDIRARGLDGLIEGEFMISRQKEGGYITRTVLSVTDIDINKAFISFKNFGQDFISSDNLQGNLTGTLTMLSPLDASYKIAKKALVAEAHLLITEGRLANFGPAERLSSYLDMDELKDIRFSRLENDLFINNGNVSIPKMLINSSAVNFTVYGTHSFNNDYSYHMRLLLSEVLSRKARERNRDVSSFGQVRVDGSGKATIPLKIVCVNGKTEVGYDFGQAQDNIKTDVALEKQNLKGILNEEYGWYQADTVKVKPDENRPKFKITWEEGKEPPPATAEKQEEVTESPIKILLKKKK